MPQTKKESFLNILHQGHNAMPSCCRQVEELKMFMGRGGGLAGQRACYSNDRSSNPSEGYSFFAVKCWLIRTKIKKRPRLAHC